MYIMHTIETISMVTYDLPTEYLTPKYLEGKYTWVKSLPSWKSMAELSVFKFISSSKFVTWNATLPLWHFLMLIVVTMCSTGNTFPFPVHIFEISSKNAFSMFQKWAIEQCPDVPKAMLQLQLYLINFHVVSTHF